MTRPLPNQAVSRTQSRHTSAAILWPALVFLVVLYAGILIRWPDNFFADDSYFYFQVASNFAHGLGSTFNGLMLTNGYHPLWMLVCAAVFKVVPDKFAAVHTIGTVIALLNLSALVDLTLLLRRARVSLPFVAWLLYLPFCFTTQLGTEGALSGAFLAATLLIACRLATRPHTLTAALYALFAALTVLSRLDNIFIIFFLSLALVLGSAPTQRRTMLRLLLLASPIAFALWAAYLFSNRHWFGTWQPISGLLKSHSKGEHKLFSNLPHIALLDLGIIAVCLTLTNRLRRDLFHRVIELPFAAGVLLHALYIVFVMSSETRWSWYYTTWTLLAAILLARAASLIADRRPALRLPALAAVTAVLLAVWFTTDIRHFAHNNPASQDPGFQANAVQHSGLHTLLAFDKPGRLAYYSTAQIVPLDGLMGNLQFQQDLANTGILPFIQANHVDGFIGPPQPLDDGGKRNFCDTIFLSSAQFHCVPAGPGKWTVDRVDIFARLTNTPAGSIALSSSQMVWNAPGYVAAWRIDPQAGR